MHCYQTGYTPLQQSSITCSQSVLDLLPHTSCGHSQSNLEESSEEPTLAAQQSSVPTKAEHTHSTKACLTKRETSAQSSWPDTSTMNCLLSHQATGGGYVCVDLRTGQQLWKQNYTVNPTFGQLYGYDSINQHGVLPNGWLWAVSGTTWIAYDGMTGNWVFNLTNVPTGTLRYGTTGEIVKYNWTQTENG